MKMKSNTAQARRARKPQPKAPPPKPFDPYAVISREQLTLTALLGPMRQIEAQLDRRWGAGRWLRMVSPELAGRYEAQRQIVETTAQEVRDRGVKDQNALRRVSEAAEALFRGAMAVDSAIQEQGVTDALCGAEEMLTIEREGVVYAVYHPQLVDPAAVEQAVADGMITIRLDDLVALAAQEHKRMWGTSDAPPDALARIRDAVAQVEASGIVAGETD